MTDDFSALYRAISGRPADEAFVERVRDVCRKSGREPEDFPAYLSAVARDLAARRERPPTAVPDRDRGYSWLLAELASALPGTAFENAAEGDVFAVRPLNMAATISRGVTPETYTVTPLPRARARETVTVIGTFNPTPHQVREWAYSPNVRLTAQDEDLAVSHLAYVPLLIELASDPTCPKRTYILSIVDGYLASARRGGFDRDLLRLARRQASQVAAADVRTWGGDLDYLLQYVDGRGPIDAATAKRIASITMVGRHRPAVTLDDRVLGEWRTFTARGPDGREIDRLYVSPQSGALVWSRTALTAAQLAPFANPPRRDDPLRSRAGTS